MTRAAPSPADGPPILLVTQVAESSPLGRLIGKALDGRATARFEAANAPAARRWRRSVTGTELQWWNDPRPANRTPGSPASGAMTAAEMTAAEMTAAAITVAAITVDLHGSAAPVDPAGRVWQIVNDAGVPLFGDMHALDACHRQPFTASLFLIERTGAMPQGHVLAEAHLSSAVAYRRLVGALGAAAAGLLRRGLSQPHQPIRPWLPGPPAPRPHLRRPHLPLTRARVAAGAHWLRARLGGDLYGIAVLDQAPATCLKDTVLAPPRWYRMDPAQGFIADPFFWPGRPGVVLCEAYSHRTGLGTLANFNIGPQDPPDIIDVRSAGHHLSYPYAWPEGGRILCVPEMAATRRQVLYELKPGKPMTPLCVVAEDVAMADPTIIRDGDLYWLMYTDAEQGPYDNLCLMFAERPEGPWRFHPGNPVKVDVRSSRPGGTPFRVGGRLFRPAQDCSRTYGGALAINAVTECTPERYTEHVVAMLRPDPAGEYPDGVHTLAVSESQLLIDGKRISFHPAIAWNKLRRRGHLITGVKAKPENSWPVL